MLPTVPFFSSVMNKMNEGIVCTKNEHGSLWFRFVKGKVMFLSVLVSGLEHAIINFFLLRRQIM